MASTYTKAEWDIVNAVRKNPKTIMTFMQRVARSREIPKTMPTTHKFIASLCSQAERNMFLGKPALTPDQGVALDKTIIKYAPLMAPILAAEKQGKSTTTQSDEQIERAAIQEEVRGSDENAPITMQPE